MPIGVDAYTVEVPLHSLQISFCISFHKNSIMELLIFISLYIPLNHNLVWHQHRICFWPMSQWSAVDVGPIEEQPQVRLFSFHQADKLESESEQRLLSFPQNCALKTLDLNGNHLEGKVPESLANCMMLEVLNLGNNEISDDFLKNSSSLRVLVLRSNRFQGGILCPGGENNTWVNLQIVDLASNNFSGILPQSWYLNWRGMMVDKKDTQSKLNHLRFEFLHLNHFYYQDTVTVTNKGLEMELVKILTVFTSIDISNNSFQGTIPESAGVLTSLYVLNLSHNALTGSIPSSIGNLKEIGSLDLSMNKLNGVIPTQLANLTFLSFLNLSYNLLVGRIPAGSQFQTFSENSFKGNKGLCGFPLKSNCFEEVIPPSSPTFNHKPSSPESEVYISAALGFVVGLGFIIGPLLFSGRWRVWYFKCVDRVLLRKIIQQQEQTRRNRRAYRNPIPPLRAHVKR